MSNEIKLTLNEVSFTWDNNKAAANFRKHNVSFALAAEVLFDDYAVYFPDSKHSADEDRWQVIGTNFGNDRILFVVYVERVIQNNVELIRIISARDANRKEVEIYGMVLPQKWLPQESPRRNKGSLIRQRRRH